jgi:TatD DNase family protein
MTLIDTHTHLDSFARRGDLPAMLARARAAGVSAMIAIGTEPDDWTLHRDLAREHAGTVSFSVGLHPCCVDEGWAQAVAQMEAFWGTGAAPRLRLDPTSAKTSEGRQGYGGQMGENAVSELTVPRPVALGECGLDRFHLPKEAIEAGKVFAWQRAAFAAQLEIAKRLNCPLVVHSRGAFRECVEMIDASGLDWARVVFHCFSEGAVEMAELARRGGRGSITGILTYKNADAVRAAARAQGLGRLMIETDAPYLTPMPHRGKPNEPAFLRHTAECAAEFFGVTLDELAGTTTANAKNFFGI